MSVTWILGAGFSRSLGGPLLGDLLGERLQAKISSHVGHVRRARAAAAGEPNAASGGEDDEEEEAQIARLRDILYQFGQLQRLYATVQDREGLDPEEFLELLEWQYCGVAAPEATRAAEVLGAAYARVAPNIGNEDRVARRYLAAATHYFAEGYRESEQIGPYRRWARLLDPTDTVITFNYDIVPELAAGGAFNRPIPGHPDRSADRGHPTLLKLHGSIDWIRQTSSNTVESIRPDCLWEMINDPQGPDPALVGPGPLKHETARRDFGDLWSRAEEAIRTADAIVLVGYRLSPHDAYARQRIADSISANGRRPAVHLVLGPARDDDVERTLSMLAWLQPGAGAERVVLQRMWAEDFLSVFKRDRLLPPAPPPRPRRGR